MKHLFPTILAGIFFLQSTFAQSVITQAVERVETDSSSITSTNVVPEQTPSSERATDPEALKRDIESLTATLKSIQSLEQRQTALRGDFQNATDEFQKKSIRDELTVVDNEIDRLRRQYRQIAYATNLSLFFEQKPEEPFDWKKEVEQLLAPILEEWKRATEDARKLSELRTQKEQELAKREAAVAAGEHLKLLMKYADDPELKERLEASLAEWNKRVRDSDNQLIVLDNQIEKLTPDDTTMLQRSKDAATNFIRNIGLNLILAVLAFTIVLLVMKGITRIVTRVRRKDEKNFTSRLGALIWNSATIALGFGSMMLVFNMRGDLFLFSLSLVFVLGVGWAGFKMLPQYTELVRLMLNIGAVKENERLVFQDIPWKVDSIGFVTRLVNPSLEGGEVFLPTRMVVGMISRPNGQNEEWFPCRKDDWILLSDGTYGKVTWQAPSGVQLTKPGGSQKTYPTTEFLSLHPSVLTTGFRIETDFGVDYSHLSLVDTIAKTLERDLLSTLTSWLGENCVQHVEVRLASAGDSALVFHTISDFKGEAAEEWERIPRRTEEALVASCVRESWAIPFPHMQLQFPSDPLRIKQDS